MALGFVLLGERRSSPPCPFLRYRLPNPSHKSKPKPLSRAPRRNEWPSTKVDAARIVVPLAALYTPMKHIESMPATLPYEPAKCKGKNCGAVLHPFWCVCQPPPRWRLALTQPLPPPPPPTPPSLPPPAPLFLPRSHVDFTSKHWTCSFCLTRNQFSQYYADHIAPEHLPAELMYSTVEFAVPTARGAPSGPPAFLFVVDATTPEDDIENLRDSILNALAQLPPTALVGFITYSTMVHVHEVAPGSDCPRAYVFKGSKDYEPAKVAALLGLAAGAGGATGGGGGGGGGGPPGAAAAHVPPASNRFLVPNSAAGPVIEALLGDMGRDPWPMPPERRPSRAMGAAVSIATSLMERAIGKQGGRIFVFASGPGTIGPGATALPEYKDPMRGHTELVHQKGEIWKLHTAARDFFRGVAARLVDSAHALDFFGCSLDQVGLLELKPCVAATGGLVVLADSFGQSVFKESFVRIFKRWDEGAHPPDAGHLKMGFGATLEVLTSRDFKVSGAIGLCTSLKRPSPSVSEQEIGESGTCAWALGALDATSTLALYFDVPGAVSDADKRLHLQLITRYQHSSGAQRMRVTTHQGRWAGNDPGALNNLALSFDQEAAAVAMSRIAVHRTDSAEDSGEVLRWLDRSLIRLCSKFAEYQKDDPSSFRLSPTFSLFPQFMFNLRRSQFMQTFGSSPDESAYARLIFCKEDVMNSQVMIQPTLMSFSMAEPAPKPVLLDATSVRGDCVLLLDTFFQVLVWHGETVANWRDNKWADQPGYEQWGVEFKRLLLAPQEEAAGVMEARFPMPRYILCDQHKSQARFLMSRLNPSITHNSDSSGVGAGAAVITDDVSYSVFMEHLIKLATQTS
jgi:protein transport protein SEC23